MAWRTCYASDVKRAEINARWPGRDRRSDGTIGDAAHATRQSDHNPWLQFGGMGIVRADDVDVDGIDAGWYAEHVRLLGANGDRRVNPGGYVIFNRRIAGAHTGWAWRAYTGSNPHTSHVHTSYSSKIDDFDLRHPWGIAGGASVPSRPTARATLRLGSRGPEVSLLQQVLGIPDDGMFGPSTDGAVRAYQAYDRMTVDGVVGSATWDRLESDMSKIDDIHHQLCRPWNNPTATRKGPGHGWPIELICETHRELTQRLPSRSAYRTGDDRPDTTLGHTINGDARAHEVRHEVRDLSSDLNGRFAGIDEQFRRLDAKLDALLAQHTDGGPQ